eukprot:COSAG01_NODE_5747_length_4061_cov_13.898536_2_plen_92_part_00
MGITACISGNLALGIVWACVDGGAGGAGSVAAATLYCCCHSITAPHCNIVMLHDGGNAQPETQARPSAFAALRAPMRLGTWPASRAHSIQS